MIDIQYADESDLDSWMQLVLEVSWNFPGLETEELLKKYEQTVIKNIKRKSAICAKDGADVVGILLFSVKYNMLCCMAVSQGYRNKRIATRMIDLMLEDLDKTREVIVTTFRENDEKGIAPRELYKKLGFVEDELIEEFGYPNQKFVLYPKFLKG